MRPLRRGLALHDILRLSACLAAVATPSLLGGCAGGAGERVYGYQASIAEAWSTLDKGSRLSGMSSAQEEAIIAQAIVAHEMRRP